eukprot:s2312_g12.t1
MKINVIPGNASSKVKDVKDHVVSEATIFETEVNPVANSRHIYSQARKKLALLTSHSPHGSDDGHDGHHPGKGTLMPAASRHWSRASSAIYHGVKATQRAKIATSVVKKLAVTKQVGREELLHEKFANLLAMNDLEERVAVRYGEAKQFTEKLRSMQKSLNPRDQLQAIDAAQSVLDKLEHVRQTVEVIDDASLQDVDVSLAELAALCGAKSLKSKFHRAGRAAMVLNRLHADGAGGNTPRRNKEVLRQAFKRAIKKASVAVLFDSPNKDSPKRSHTKTRILTDDDDLLSPSTRILHKLEDSEHNFLTTSAEVKAAAKRELLTLGAGLPEPEAPDFDDGINEARAGSKPLPRRRKMGATITASYTLEDASFDFSWSMSPRAFRAASKGDKGDKGGHGGGSTGAKPMDRAALAAKKQMVRALMLEMHLREVRGQGPLPPLSDGAASLSINRLDGSKPQAPRVKTMPDIAIGSSMGSEHFQGGTVAHGHHDPWASWPLQTGQHPRVANTPQSSRAEASPFSPISSVSPHPANVSMPSMPSTSSMSPTIPITPSPDQRKVGSHLKGGLPLLKARPAAGGSLGQKSPHPPARHSNSLESQDMTPEGFEDSEEKLPKHPQRVAAGKEDFAAVTFADSIRSAIGLPSSARSANRAAENAATGVSGAQDHLKTDPKRKTKGIYGSSAPAMRRANWDQVTNGKKTSPRSTGVSGETNIGEKSPRAQRQDLPKGKGPGHSAKSGSSLWDAAQGSIDANPSEAAKEGSAEKPSGAAKGGGKVASFERSLEATESPEKSKKPSEVGEKSRNDWRDEEIAPLLEELDVLCQAGQVEEAAFAAAAFLTTVGINPPQLLQWGRE